MMRPPSLAALLAMAALSACADATARGYADYDRYMIQIGHHRLDRNPADAPFTNADLAENFIRVALAVETMGGQEASAQPLRRWEQPIVYTLFGDGVTPADRLLVGAFMDRLAAASGLEIREGSENINLPIMFLGDAERWQAHSRVRGGHTPAMRFLTDFLGRADAENPCRGTLRHNDRYEVVFAAVLIKDEVSGTLRRACIEEELAQSLGLTNDDDSVRPSLFNDDQEFAVLTVHDELLLRVLYDRRLRSGMEEAEVRPLLPRIIRDLRAGES
ncbi:MAG TPA: DUF2927 domain-containing protein [Paracoccaceae bacterium]|nr:DUF2927 domain-containing protein [Paracoccaceae bacterium]